VQRATLAEIRERTYKPVDAWWTVLLVDPVAARLVWLVAPYRWITPNLLTALATVLGLAAAACFAVPDRGALVAGALLFHLSFVVDCMDGKIARLNGTGSMFGAWFDFMFDRLRVIACAVTLMGGQYARTGDLTYLWAATGVVALDLLRYLNSSQMAKTRRALRRSLTEAYAEMTGLETPPPVATHAEPDGARRLRAQAREFLRAHRIRTHLVSGIEYEMAVFIIGPLTGATLGTALVAGALLLAFELRLIYYLWRSTRRHAVRLARLTPPAGPYMDTIHVHRGIDPA
jgi:phosphatidylglycerophosphate synthase